MKLTKPSIKYNLWSNYYEKTILSIFASLLLIPSLAMASNSTLDKISKSSAVNNELANIFSIHIKFVKYDSNNGFHYIY